MEKVKLLTNREQEVYSLTIKGLSARQVGIILKLSPKTVEYYVDIIKKKKGVYRKSQLIQRED